MRKITKILFLIVLFSVLMMTLLGCAKVNPPPPINVENLEVWMENDFYVGSLTYVDGLKKSNEINLSGIFDPSYELIPLEHSGKANLSGTLLTITGEGKFKIKILQNKEHVYTANVHIVKDGINVFNFEQFYYATRNADPVVLQADIVLQDPRTLVNPLIPPLDKKNPESLDIVNNIYGNGHVIDASAVVSKMRYEGKKCIGGANALDCSKATDITLQDFKITGKVLPSEYQLDLQEFNNYGCLINIDGVAGFKPSVNLKNIIAENSHKVIFMNACIVNMEGCIVRNASDSTISIETNGEGGSKVVMKNNVIANSLTAGVVLWGYQSVGSKEDYNNPAKFVNLTIEGFLDIYNWKDSETTTIMPATESMADLVNSEVAKEINKAEYNHFFYHKNGKKYVHLGMIVLATGVPGLKENKAVINKMNDVNFVTREFPLPGFAKAFCHTCKVIGYDSKIDIEPESTIGDNENLYKELRYGRK